MTEATDKNPLQIAPYKIADGRDMKIGKRDVNPEQKTFLVYNHRQGVLGGVHQESMAPVGLGFEREDYRRHPLEMWPGLNYISRTLFEKLMESNPVFKRNAEKWVKAIGTAKSFASLSDREAIDMINNTSDIDTLKRIRKEGGKMSKEVTSALDDEIEDLGKRDKEERDERLQQRRANRRRRRM